MVTQWRWTIFAGQVELAVAGLGFPELSWPSPSGSLTSLCSDERHNATDPELEGDRPRSSDR